MLLGNRWGRRNRAVWRANDGLSSVEAAVSPWARRSELCTLDAVDAVVVSQHPACSSPGTTFATPQWEIFGSVLEASGLAGRAFSYECILGPVGRSAQMPAAFLIPGSSALLQHEKSNDIALNCATTKRHTVVCRLYGARDCLPQGFNSATAALWSRN